MGDDDGQTTRASFHLLPEFIRETPLLVGVSKAILEVTTVWMFARLMGMSISPWVLLVLGAFGAYEGWWNAMNKQDDS
jgi:hypothetical protein